MTKKNTAKTAARKMQKATGRSYQDCLNEVRTSKGLPRGDVPKEVADVARITAKAYLEKLGHVPNWIPGTEMLGCLCGVIVTVRPELPAPHFEDFAIVGRCP